jgi:hypothetical protein
MALRFFDNEESQDKSVHWGAIKDSEDMASNCYHGLHDLWW